MSRWITGRGGDVHVAGVRFLPVERGVFLRTLSYRQYQFNTENPTTSEVNGLKALKLAYFAAANFWVGLAALVAIPTGLLWSFRRDGIQAAIAAALTSGIMTFGLLCVRRYRQAQACYPDTVKAVPWYGIFPPKVPDA